LNVFYSSTRAEEGGYTDGQVGVNMDFYFSPLDDRIIRRRVDVVHSHLLVLRVGYVFEKTPSDSKKPFTEHTAVVELTRRFKLPKKILVSDRNRGDLRFKNGEFLPRYRNELTIERSFSLGKRALTPYASVEAFYDSIYDKFDQFRYIAGSEFEVNKHLVFRAYYLRQHVTDPNSKSTNILGLKAQVFFH
jgi:hypothetical protein